MREIESRSLKKNKVALMEKPSMQKMKQIGRSLNIKIRKTHRNRMKKLGNVVKTIRRTNNLKKKTKRNRFSSSSTQLDT